jgi:hypothetical protein
MEFVVNKVALVQVFSGYFSFPPPIFIPPKFSIITITRGRNNRPVVADVPSGLNIDSTAPPHYANLKK